MVESHKTAFMRLQHQKQFPKNEMTAVTRNITLPLSKCTKNRRRLTPKWTAKKNENNQTAPKLIINRINNNKIKRKKQQKQYWSRRWRWSQDHQWGSETKKREKTKTKNGPHTLACRGVATNQRKENNTNTQNWLRAESKTLTLGIKRLFNAEKKHKEFSTFQHFQQ